MLASIFLHTFVQKTGNRLRIGFCVHNIAQTVSGTRKGEKMKLTTILFDLDGTLLPMDNDAFTKGHFKLLDAKLAPHGYEPKQLVDAVWAGTAAMVKTTEHKATKKPAGRNSPESMGKRYLLINRCSMNSTKRISIMRKAFVDSTRMPQWRLTPQKKWVCG